MSYRGGAETDAVVAGTKGKRGPALPSSTPYKVKDVLLSSGRMVSPASYDLFAKAVDLLVTKALADRFLSDILLIAASQMFGSKNLLRPGELQWRESGEDAFVTIVFPGATLDFTPDKAEGETVDDPAAVYVGTSDSLPGSRVPDCAATLIHEYTHVVLGRKYRNNSAPWPALEWHEKDARKDSLVEAFQQPVKQDTFDERLSSCKKYPEVEIALQKVLRDWAGYRNKPGALNAESVPYYVEGAFQLAYAGSPDGMVKVFGQPIVDAVNKYLVPEIRESAEAVERAAVVTL